MHRRVALLLCFAIAASGADFSVAKAAEIKFDRPLCLAYAEDGSDSLYVVEQIGRIRSFDRKKPGTEAEKFLDISDHVLSEGTEEGLLALAFHPQFKTNRFFYVYYCVAKPRRTRIARFTVGADGKADAASEKVLLEIDQPYANHNGSSLLFGPDHFLYSSPGDGGSGGDPHDNGQRLDTLLGKILRIDVDKEQDEKPYATPKDNPFVGKQGVRGEIWAYGIRNAWRMSFDRKTGDLWAGDVGQNLWEEIDVIVKGGNYGWNRREGLHVFKDGPGNFIDPLVEYSHQVGKSVTGGYVYRGKKMPKLQGIYLYGDFDSGVIWGLRADKGKLVANQELLQTGKHISSFGEDQDGEIYLTAFDGFLYRLSP